MRRGFRSSWRILTIAAFVLALMPAAFGMAGRIASPASVSAACAGDTGDTSGGGNTVVTLSDIEFGAHPVIRIPVPHAFGRGGFMLTLVRSSVARISIVSGDTIRITQTRSGTFTVNVSRPDCTLLTQWLPPIIVSPPPGPGRWQLQVLTKNGFHALVSNAITGPGVFRWVLLPIPAPHLP